MATLGLKSAFSPSAYQLNILIEEASDYVEDYCDRKFALTTVTETRYGPKGRPDTKFLADNYPVVSLTSAYWEAPDGMTGQFDVSDFRILEGGIIEWKPSLAYTGLYGGMWYPSLFYTLTYQTGYADVPGPVQRATALKIAMLLQPQYQGPQEREIFMVTNLEQMIVDLLERYRRERLG